MHRFLVAIAVGLMPLPVAAQASGEGGIAIDLYQAAETTSDGFAISRPDDTGHLSFGVQLQADYGLAPLILADTGAANPPELVSHVLGLRAGVSLGLLDRMVIFGSLPVVALMEGEAVPGPTPNADGGGLGDPTLGTRVRLAGDEEDVGAVALQLTGSIPLAEAITSTQALRGDGGVTFQPEVLGEVRFEMVHVTANLGAIFRTAPTFANFDIEHELTWGLGVGATFLDDVLEARLEGYGRVSLSNPGEAFRSPAEALLGLRVRPIDGLVIGAAGGAGLGPGYGVPAFRGVVSVGWSSAAEERAVTPSDPETHGVEPEATTSDTPTVADGDPATAQAERARDEGPEVGTSSSPSTSGATEDGGITAASSAGPEPDERTAAGQSAASDEAAAPVPAAGATPRTARPEYEQLDRDADRVVDAQDHCPIDREDFDEVQDEDGCPEEDADGDSVPDTEDTCPLTAGDRRGNECSGCPELACVARDTGRIQITQRVEFESGAATLLDSSQQVLNDLLSIMTSNEQIARLRIEGHTDDVGNDDRNLVLSMRRAATVRSWLTSRGVDEERLVGFGCGEMFPLASGSSARVRARNRRVEFLIVDPPSGEEIRQGCRPAVAE